MLNHDEQTSPSNVSTTFVFLPIMVRQFAFMMSVPPSVRLANFIGEDNALINRQRALRTPSKWSPFHLLAIKTMLSGTGHDLLWRIYHSIKWQKVMHSKQEGITVSLQHHQCHHCSCIVIVLLQLFLSLHNMSYGLFTPFLILSKCQCHQIVLMLITSIVNVIEFYTNLTSYLCSTSFHDITVNVIYIHHDWHMKNLLSVYLQLFPWRILYNPFDHWSQSYLFVESYWKCQVFVPQVQESLLTYSCWFLRLF